MQSVTPSFIAISYRIWILYGWNFDLDPLA